MLPRWPFPSGIGQPGEVNACGVPPLRPLFLQRSFSFPRDERLQRCKALGASRGQATEVAARRGRLSHLLPPRGKLPFAAGGGAEVLGSRVSSLPAPLGGADLGVEMTQERPKFYRQELNKTIWEVPERYQNLSPVGSGAYGSVW